MVHLEKKVCYPSISHTTQKSNTLVALAQTGIEATLGLGWQFTQTFREICLLKMEPLDMVRHGAMFDEKHCLLLSESHG